MGSLNSSLSTNGDTSLRGSKALEVVAGGSVVAGLFSMAVATSVLFLSRSMSAKYATSASPYEQQTKSLATIQQIKRTMIPVSPKGLMSSNQPSFTILQMNTLADGLCDPSAFPFSDPATLEWQYRKQHLISILTEHPHDILCLQEVDRFEEYYSSSLGAKGYQGIFKEKTDPASRIARDGCAIFYNASRFEFLDKSLVEFGLACSQIAILVKLRLIEEGNEQTGNKGLLVATTHLKAKGGFEELRLQQGHILLKKIQEFIKDDDQVKGWPIVITGDFNDVPGSPVFQLFSEGSYIREESPETESVSMNHPFTLGSAYPLDIFTTYKNRGKIVKRCIDYIWYDVDRLKLTERLEIPSTDSMPHLLPAAYYPSDHLAIAAKFVWQAASDQENDGC